MIRAVLSIVLLCLTLIAQAQMTIQSIQLHNRTAQEVIPILMPMLNKSGSLTGTGYKLFIKSTPENIAQIRQMLAEIDQAAKNLIVSVSLDPSVIQENQQASAGLHLDSGRNHIDIGKNGASSSNSKRDKDGHHIMYDTQLLQQMQTQRAPQTQTVRVSEGLWATIHTGQSVPVATRTRNPDGTVTDTYTYQSVGSGFQVMPRVNGDTVTLTIRPQSQSINQDNAGAYDTTALETTVSGKLGQWIALGGVSQQMQTQESGITYQTRQRQDTNNQIYVKVELAK